MIGYWQVARTVVMCTYVYIVSCQDQRWVKVTNEQMTLLPTESLRLLLQTDANSFSSIDEFVNAAVASLADALSKRRPHFDPEVDENLNVFACSCGGILVEPVTFTDGSSICKLCSMNQTADGRVPAGMRETGESSTAVALPAPCVMLSNVVKKHFEAHIDAVRLRVEGEEALNVGDCTKAIDLYTTALRIGTVQYVCMWMSRRGLVVVVRIVCRVRAEDVLTIWDRTVCEL